MAVIVTGRDLTPEEVVLVARSDEPVELAPGALERMAAARGIVEVALGSGLRVYGLTTGVGARRDVDVTPGELATRFAGSRDLYQDERLASSTRIGRTTQSNQGRVGNRTPSPLDLR